MKVHLLNDDLTAARTRCGVELMPDSGGSVGLWETVGGRDLIVAIEGERPTCRKCRAIRDRWLASQP